MGKNVSEIKDVSEREKSPSKSIGEVCIIPSLFSIEICPLPFVSLVSKLYSELYGKV